MNNIGGIYSITNTVNGHKYIGSAVNIQSRWMDHKKQLRKGRHHSKHLQSAWNKYGEAAFAFSVLRIVQDKKELIANEQEFIDKLNPEYNICRVAGSTLGFKQPAHVGKAVALANHNRQHSEETRRKLACNKGKKFTEDHKKRMVLARKLYFQNGGKNGNERTIEQYSKNGVLIACYESITDAARKLGLKNTHISRVAKGKRKSTGGFVWRYASE